MEINLDRGVVRALARQTFLQAAQSPILYVVAIFFYGFVGAIFGLNYFLSNQASIDGVGQIAPWALWFVIPALTMGLIADELRTGTFEVLATLPIRDWEIVLGKFAGFALTALALITGLGVYAVIAALTVQPGLPLGWGGGVGVLAGLYLLCLSFGAMGLFASSLARNQVVALIGGMMICTVFFLLGQFYQLFPPVLGRIADQVGVLSHLQSLSRGVWDFRDLVYFASVIGLFLYLTSQRLTLRRF